MLGDSFLKFICSQELFERHQSRHQGFLTAARARIVSNANLFESVAKSSISQYLRVETLEENGNPFLNTSLSHWGKKVNKKLFFIKIIKHRQ